MMLDTYFESESVANYYGLQDQAPTMVECLAATLGQDIEQIGWVFANDPRKTLQLVEKAKRAVRREKAKLCTRMRQEFAPVKIEEYVPCDQQYCVEPAEPKLFDAQSTSDESTQKKIVQMIRNRISAQISRDKKKVYLQDLEERLRENEENNSNLMAQISTLQRSHDQTMRENQLLKKSLKIAKTKKHNDVGLQIMILASQYLTSLPHPQRIQMENAVSEMQLCLEGL